MRKSEDMFPGACKDNVSSWRAKKVNKGPKNKNKKRNCSRYINMT
jgi:hypothetical protein